MAKLRPEKLVLIVLGVATLVLAGIGAVVLIVGSRSRSVVIAAGPGNAESAVLLRALKVVTERHYPNLKITINETEDTAESLRRLERGEAQLAASQADANVGPSALLVAVLFEDAFEVLAHKQLDIKRFTDLKGKRIALPVTDSQYQSFIFLAAHFGLAPQDFTFAGTSEEGADVAFARRDADAIFRVRAPHNLAIERIARTGTVDLVPIGDALAMHSEVPAYTPTVIPKGTYLGNPPVPSADIETVASKHTLLARQDVPGDVVAAITQVLMERRPELGAYIQAKDPSVLPLLAQIQQPSASMGLGLGIHPGAMDQYRGGKVPFVQRHSDLLSFLLGLSLLAALWMWAMKRMRERTQKERLLIYMRRLGELIVEIDGTVSDKALASLRDVLTGILRRAMADVQQELLSESSFQTFHRAWESAFASLRERRAAVRHRASMAGEHNDMPAPEVVVPAAERPLWRFAKMLQPKSTP
jgi:uncharacterized protein